MAIDAMCCIGHSHEKPKGGLRKVKTATSGGDVRIALPPTPSRLKKPYPADGMTRSEVKFLMLLYRTPDIFCYVPIGVC
jgi:hypothetical protein